MLSTWTQQLCLGAKFSAAVHNPRPSCAPAAGCMGREDAEGDGETNRGYEEHAVQPGEGGLPEPRGSGGPQTFLLSNIRGLIGQGGKSKAGFLYDQAILHKSLVVAVTESWLKPKVKDSELLVNFPGYNLYRSDRQKRKNGGVCLPP